MSAALSYTLPADPVTDQTAAARFVFALHPFAAVCLVAQCLNEPIKTVVYRDAVALVLDQSHHLYKILTVDAFEACEEPFWIYRESAEQEENYSESFWRVRQQLTLQAPVYRGDPRPAGFRPVSVVSNFPSFGYLTDLAFLGYPLSAIQACLPHSHKPFMRSPDRRKRATSDPNDNYENAGAKKERGTANVERMATFQDPLHPYHPAAAARRSLTGGGLTKDQVRQGLAKMRTTARIKEALFEIVYRRRSTLEVADEYELRSAVLYVYATRLRKHIARRDLHEGKKNE